MKATTRTRSESLWRILLATLVGPAVIACASGSDRGSSDEPPQLKIGDAPTDQALVVRPDKTLDARPKPAFELPRKPQPSDSDRYETPGDASPKKTPRWYEGLWDDPRFILVVGRMV